MQYYIYIYKIIKKKPIKYFHEQRIFCEIPILYCDSAFNIPYYFLFYVVFF